MNTLLLMVLAPSILLISKKLVLQLRELDGKDA